MANYFVISSVVVSPQVSERVEDNMAVLSRSLTLWEHIAKVGRELESWSTCAVAELSDSLGHLDDSQRTDRRLTEIQVLNTPVQCIQYQRPVGSTGFRT